MKQLVLFLVALIALTATNVLSASAQDSSATKAVSAEEAKQIRESVKSLGILFGLQDTAAATKTMPASPPPTQKTIADVADKALDLTAKAIATIAQNIEKAAPWVWNVMIRQQYANAFARLITPWGLFISVFVAGFIIRKKWNLKEEYSGDSHLLFGRIIPLILMFILGWWGIYRLSDSIQLLINPEYYAIRDLVQIILNPRAGL